MKAVRILFVLFGIVSLIASCGEGEQRTADEDPSKDKDIRRAN